MSCASISVVAVALLLAISPYGATADPARDHGSSAGAEDGHSSGASEPADLGSAWAALGATRDAITAQHGAAGSGHEAGAHSHRQRPAGAVDANPQATLHVRVLDDLRFEPPNLAIVAGVPTRIELHNTGAAEHSLVGKTPDGKQDWIHLHAAGGGTAADTFRLDEPGTYAILCTIPGHTEGGMVGQLVVAAHKSSELRSHP